MRRYQIVLLTIAAMVAWTPVSATAQERSALARTEIWLGYFGELGTHPGIAAGARFRLVNAEWYELSAGPVIGFYIHPRNHTGLFIDVELQNRFQLPSGLFFTAGVSSGYYHTWLGGDALYVRDADGAVAESFDWGRPHLKVGGALGFGWDFSRSGTTPLRVFSQLDLFAQYPFNKAFLPHAAILAGAVYQPGGAQ